jgi:hypothetical protein
MGEAKRRRDAIMQQRSCGECSLCCKLVQPDELPATAIGEWCPHCKPGDGGCMIYPDRPRSCREFLCLWRMKTNIPDHVRPDRAGFFAWFPARPFPHIELCVDADRVDADTVDKESYGRMLEMVLGTGMVVSLSLGTGKSVFLNLKPDDPRSALLKGRQTIADKSEFLSYVDREIGRLAKASK